MLILPTKGRPLNLKRFIRAYNDTKAVIPIWLILDASDGYRYNLIETPPHWKRVSVPSGTPLGGIFERIFKKYSNEAYYGMVADDVVPETEHWDSIMMEACQPDKIVWGCDELQNERLPVHPFIGGDLVRKLGFWAAPGMKHWFVDNAWKAIADALGCGIYMPNVKMIHRHYVNGRAPMDKTYQEQPNHMADQIAYQKFMNERFHDLIKRLKSS